MAVMNAKYLAEYISKNGLPPSTPEVNPEYEQKYKEICQASQSEFPEDMEPGSLHEAIAFVERWLPDALPVDANTQVHFARALCEMLIEAAKQHLAKEAEVTNAKVAGYDRNFVPAPEVKRTTSG